MRHRADEAEATTGAVESSSEADGVPGPLAEPRQYCVHTGVVLNVGEKASDGEPPAISTGEKLSPNAKIGLEPPRFCGQCGRRMIVQVHPRGWSATCSRHGTVDSEAWERVVLRQKLQETAQ